MGSCRYTRVKSVSITLSREGVHSIIQEAAFIDELNRLVLGSKICEYNSYQGKG